MKRLALIITIIMLLSTKVNAMEFTAPEVPDSGKDFLYEEPDSFSEGLWSIAKEAVSVIKPNISKAAALCLRLLVIALLVSVAKLFPGSPEKTVELVGTAAISAVLLQPSGAMLRLGMDTIAELSEYGKLLLPVLTGALAAQGGTTASAALYSGTVLFNTVLVALISSVIVPMIYVFLVLGTVSAGTEQNMIGKLKDFVKWLMTWSLKTVLYIFTGYMGITGAVSGTADAAAVKAAKLTISGMVPVVGGILSDASEAILVGAGVMKSAVGVYGLLAVLALWIGPFLEIGVQYLLLKAVNGICGIFSLGRIEKLLQDFTTAMGIVLAMTGAVCLLQLISIVCFMKGTG